MIKKIKREDSLLLVVDFQDRLMPIINDTENLAKAAVRMIEGCKAFEIPIIVTHQYEKGLGQTIPLIKESLGDHYLPIDKTTFSCMGNEDFVKALGDSGKKTILLTGIETHICVQQTAMDLAEAGYEVVLIQDAVGSRFAPDRDCAIERMRAAGATVTTIEAALFEICIHAKDPVFKTVSAIIK